MNTERETREVLTGTEEGSFLDFYVFLNFYVFVFVFSLMDGREIYRLWVFWGVTAFSFFALSFLKVMKFLTDKLILSSFSL